MRNNMGKWSFYKIDGKPVLTAEEVHYWKTNMDRILKIGQEYEFNLPEKKTGTCKGDSNTCPCMHMTAENDCWQQCVNRDHCSVITKRFEICTNKTDRCEEEDCSSCTVFGGKCPGMACPNFVTYCLVCSDFKIKCEGCKYRFDPNKNPDAIREMLNEELKPNQSYGTVGEHGIHSITTDGSLLGKKGVEIITVGRRVDYWVFYQMAKNIIDRTTSRGAYVNERCSIHMHMLGAYYGKMGGPEMGTPLKVNEMEKSMPQIIMCNFHQLVRRYQNAMTWMMTGLPDENRLTRWEKFRVSVLEISAVMSTMQEVKDIVARTSASASGSGNGSKYGWANYNNVSFDRKGDISKFHVEMRACDNLVSPSAVAAIACMYYALLMKAIEISRYGVVEVGDPEWMEQAKEIKSHLLNNIKGYQDGDRFSNTSGLRKYYDVLIGESMDLVQQLKPNLIKIGPAYDVLERLAERPCSIRLIEGQTWEDIENDLKVVLNEQDSLEIALREIIDLQCIRDCRDLEDWVTEVVSVLKANPDIEVSEEELAIETVSGFIGQKRDDGELLWSEKIGAPIMV